MIIIDPVQFGMAGAKRASRAGYLDFDGIWKEVGNDVPRVSCRPADLSAPPYALIEPDATNEVSFPRHFNQISWSKGRSYVRPCDAVGPDGLMTADKFCEDNTTGSHIIAQNRAGMNETMTIQAIVKPAGRDIIRVGFSNFLNNSCYATFDLVQLTAWNDAPNADYVNPAYRIEAWPNGWVRCIFTVTKRADTSQNCPQMELVMREPLSGSYGGDGGSGVHVWHLGVEKGAVATSPVPDGTTFASRNSTRTVVDVNGKIVVIPANTAAYDYDVRTHLPKGLSLEYWGGNYIFNSDVEGAVGALPTGMGSYLHQQQVVTTPVIGPNNKSCKHTFAAYDTNLGYYNSAATSNTVYTSSAWIYVPPGNTHGPIMIRPEGLAGIVFVSWVDSDPAIVGEWQRISCTYWVPTGGTMAHVLRTRNAITLGMFGQSFYTDAWQCEDSFWPTSYIPSTNGVGGRSPDVANSAYAVRAADIIGSGASLLYSNVPITEPDYSAGATYAKGALVLAPGTPDIYESLVDANKGSALTDTAKWLKRKEPTNRWRMLDQYNNTQTTNPERIVLTLSPQLISQGVYLGNVDANEVSFVVQDLQKGVVYTETQNLIVSTSKSSFFKWCFGRIRRRSYAVSVMLPVYANAIVTVTLSKPGATPACGMCAVGPIVDVGLSEYGLSAEIKDYSSTTFNFDGTSETVQRGYSKRMSVDVEVDDDQADAVFEALVSFRQKPVVYLGSVMHGLACVFGKFSSFKIIVASKPLAKASLQIEGTV
jgi:hypothetical protein